MQEHDALTIFGRAAVSREADSCPLHQGGRARAGDGPFCKRLFIAATVSYRGEPKVQLLLP